MIYVSEETKQAFFNATQKNLVLTFDDGTVIDNDDIALECMDLEQTLCDTDELKYGKIASACFKTKIVASTKTYKNLWFNASIIAEKHEIKIGRFKVYTDNMTSDRLYRDIVAYDALFWAMNTDVTEWYNKIKFPITQRDFRNSLFAHLGIEQETVELPNDNIYLNRTSSAENLTGLTVLQKLCEINATWGVINNVGKFKYTRMRTHDLDALYPSENLYPSEDLYPNDIYDDRLAKGSYYLGSLKYAEYDTQPISKVTIREETDDLGYSYGSDGNTYVIENNLLMYGASDDVLEQVARNFYDYAQYIAYTPSELSCKGAPWREVGDLLSVVADKRTLTVPILNRKLSGITALNDTYIARGTETYGEVKNSPAEQIKQLQGRTNKLTRDLNGTRSEVSKKVDGEDVVSVINQSAEEILLKGNRVIIEADNFSLDKNGNVSAKNANIEGEFQQKSSNGNLSVGISNNTVVFYNFKKNGEIVGQIGMVSSVDGLDVGIEVYCEQENDVTIGIVTGIGSSGEKLIQPIIKVSYDSYTSNPPWIRNTANGTLFGNHSGGGIKVKNGFITDWGLDTTTGTIEISGNAWDTKIDVKNGLITGWRYE